MRVLGREVHKAEGEWGRAATGMIGGDWKGMEKEEGGRGPGVIGVDGVVVGAVRDQQQEVPGTGKRGRRRGSREMTLEVRS